jgi:hypothetical protein
MAAARLPDQLGRERVAAAAATTTFLAGRETSSFLFMVSPALSMRQRRRLAGRPGAHRRGWPKTRRRLRRQARSRRQTAATTSMKVLAACRLSLRARLAPTPNSNVVINSFFAQKFNKLARSRSRCMMKFSSSGGRPEPPLPDDDDD